MAECPEAQIVHRAMAQIFEEPTERAMMGLTLAVCDLDGALLLARSPKELAEIRKVAEDAIARLITISATALTLTELS